MPEHFPNKFPTTFADPIPGYAVTLGLAALKRLDLIVDGKHGIAYLRPKKTPGPPPVSEGGYMLVFMPRDAKNGDLVAHVANRSPAQEVGFWPGDVLLKIDERDLSTWRLDPGERWHRNDPSSPFLTAATNSPETKLVLTLKRDDEIVKVAAPVPETVIFAPETNSPRSLSK